jgi:hypothetical protein
MGVAAHVGQDLPAAQAFLALGLLELHADARHLGQPERLGRDRIAGQRDVRGDADIGEIDRLQRRQHLGVADMHDRRGLQAGADGLVAALHLQRRGHHAPGRRMPAHFAASAGSRQSAGCRGSPADAPSRRRRGSATARHPPS